MIIDHAHPTWVAGHPFKGSWVLSTGQLEHPDLKRFALTTAVLFKPVFPGKNPYDQPVQHPSTPSFSQFFSAYFGSKAFNISNDRCSKMLEGMQRVINIIINIFSVIQITKAKTLLKVVNIT